MVSVREPPPVFNKRLFKARAGIVLTDEILQILQKSLADRRLPQQLHAIKPVVSALKDIHKGLQFIKEALGHVVTYEKVEADTEICKACGEKCLSCYYILTGSVQAMYEISPLHPQEKSNDCEINYTHVAGEYLGLVSGEGPELDYPPPDRIRTMEVSEFLRVDREKFHKAVKRVQNRYFREIKTFFGEVKPLKSLPIEEKKKLISLMARQEYPAGAVIVSQGDVPEHVFFVAKGRCQYYRKVFIDDEINREELVKLGQIEKGEFFGESSALDSSPCFCSVASIGPVTCYLVNKWAIKTNEPIIQILQQNRRYFFTDSDIKRYIRDSDIWQSYKRCIATGLLETAGKCHMAAQREHMTRPLSRAVDHGDANRTSLNKPNQEHKMPESPKNAKQLYVSPPSRRRSSAILNCNAAAVVKAVLLLRLKPETDPNSKLKDSFRRQTVASYKEQRRFVEEWQPKLRSAPGTSCPRVFGASGFLGYGARSAKKNLRNGPLKHQSIKTNRTSKLSKCDISLPCVPVRIGNQGMKHKPPENTEKGKKIESFSSRGKKRSEKEQGASLSTISSTDTKNPSVSITKEIDTPGQKTNIPSSGHKKVATRKPNVVVKEIINTGIPGKRMSPTSYRRFEKSMFDVLDRYSDKDTSSPAKDALSPSTLPANPWNLSFATSKWLSAIRQQRKHAHAQEMSHITNQPPIIVIEDWSPIVHSDSDARGEDASNSQLSTSDRKAGRKASRTPTPVLDDVTEESEEEIQKYEAGSNPLDSWYTSIHETRDVCQRYLNEVKKEVESLERQRKLLKSQPTTKSAVTLHAEKSLQDDNEEEDIKNNETGVDHPSDKTSSSLDNHRIHRQVAVSRRNVNHSGVGRNRAKTFSEESGESANELKHGNELRRTQSLGRFLLIGDSFEMKRALQNSSNQQSAELDDKVGRSRMSYTEIQRISIEPRLARRRQLLRTKIEEMKKKPKNITHKIRYGSQK